MHYLVEIHGDAFRAMGLLALAGIQNTPRRGAVTERVTARLSADSAKRAVDRVRHALEAGVLGDSGFTIGDIRRDV